MRVSVTRRMRDEGGTTLLMVLMIMMLLSGLMVGFYAVVTSDQRSSGVDRDQTQVYAVAHAGLEKLTSDLAALFTTNFAPNASAINTLATHPPSMPGFNYTAPDGSSGYTITFTADANGNPAPDDPNGTPITSGPYQGFMGIITPYNILVTARSSGGSEVRMKRTLQTISVPVFQFGVFSEGDLSFFAGPNFNFGGRVHTNGNLYLAEGDSDTLTLSDRVTAVGEVVRTNLSNGFATGSGSTYTGTVNAIKSTGVYRALARTEGSLVGTLGSALNDPTWTNLSIGTYNSNIRNGRTGATRLDLPLVSQGAKPRDLIRRPVPGEDTSAPLILGQRYFQQASLRILLSDTAAEISNLPTIVTGTPPVSLENALTYGPSGKQAPLATSGGSGVDGNYKSNATTPLIGGFIKIEKQDNSGAWTDVTAEILNLGIVGRNLSNGTADTVFTGSNGQNSTANGCLGSDPQPNAVIKLQRVKDRPSTHSGATATLYQYDCAVTSAGVPDPTSYDYIPLALYDTREGNTRDSVSTSSTAIAYGGVMYYVELDMNNLARWFNGAIGSTGTQAKNNNGRVVYFSDRRNNSSPNASDCATGLTAPCETGEYGYEDIVNPSDSNGVPNGTLDSGEDLNVGEPGGGTLQTYGQTPQNVPAGAASPLTSAIRPMTTGSLTSQIVRLNRPLLFRRALKLINGGGTNLRSSGITGLTIAAENPIYVQGDYNVGNPANYATETHIACSILADAVTLLSNNWNDIRSFTSPNDPTGRSGTTTSYRTAVVAGKGLSFPQPTWSGVPKDFGTDGGAHNFLRYVEDWSGATLNYRGSIVTFYTSRQAVGTYKCCTNVYDPPTRGYVFDADFLIPSMLPPGTPMFRDINTLTFRELLRPNQ
jgi:hypothetical protein